MSLKQIAIGFLISAVTVVSGQALRVDSVSVDSIWNMDNPWTDSAGNPQISPSRRMLVSFLPQGSGMARIFVDVSLDSGKSWMLLREDAEYPTGRKSTSFISFNSADREGIIIRVRARQYAPQIVGNPAFKIIGAFTPMNPDDSMDIPFSVGQKGDFYIQPYTNIIGFAWDAWADGIMEDTTRGSGWTGRFVIPSVTGNSIPVAVRAQDQNGLWSIPETLKVQFGLRRPFQMCNIPAGQLNRADTTCIISAFKLSSTEVTQELYLAVRGMNPSYFSEGLDALLRPVESVSASNAIAFCNSLSQNMGKVPAYRFSGSISTITVDTLADGFRLPNEDEWEYACRSGRTTDYSWGRNWPIASHDDTTAADSHAVWLHNSNEMTQPVAGKAPNGWGLYDMHGNVLEFCFPLRPSAYGGPSAGQRGGSFRDDDEHLRANLSWGLPYSGKFIGFRVACK